jgi:hypothetical protein
MGDMEERFDHPVEARAAFERALTIYDALLKANPENTFSWSVRRCPSCD